MIGAGCPGQSAESLGARWDDGVAGGNRIISDRAVISFPHGPVPRVSATGCEGSNRARNATSGTTETVARLRIGRDAHLSIVTRVRSIGVGPGRIGGSLLRGGSTKIIQSELENEIGCDGDEIFHCGSVGIGFFF